MKKVDRKKLQDWLHEQQSEALKECKEQESNCQCSGDGEDYAKYGALFCQAQARLDSEDGSVKKKNGKRNSIEE